MLRWILRKQSCLNPQ